MRTDTDWWEWLRDLTHETTQRAVAKKIGVAHTTVQRWSAHGVPSDLVLPLAVRFHGDPVRAAILAGVITDADAMRLNWSAVVEYVPTEVLTGELHRRATESRYADTPAVVIGFGRN